ncbi:precorrin-2 C(20)-methyltransferase [Acidocella aminolytica]|jgi:precorrin-2/cobalt-factor-2 C20-methyltransferase|nr:precorrin-2 C(20)-methyltransferase [Acidocella aminolytica]
MSMGRIICAGLGPGDPDLMSLRAARAVQGAGHVAYFRKAGRQGQARRIVEGMLAPGCVEYAMEYPVTTELSADSAAYISVLNGFYDDWATRLEKLAATEEVVVLCEGDPFFYGSFMHLHVRLRGRVEMEIVPGITGMSGCWTATGRPITWGRDILTILPGTLPQDELARRMRESDAFVVMKTGRNLPKIKRALVAAGRLEAAVLVAHGTTRQQRIVHVSEMAEGDCPYFAVVMAHGGAGRE